MVGKFQETYPNADIEVEKIKDDSEYWNAMKMRASANQLPDVMFNKTFTLSRFKDYLVDLSDTEAAKNNELAAGYAAVSYTHLDVYKRQGVACGRLSWKSMPGRLFCLPAGSRLLRRRSVVKGVIALVRRPP